MWEGRRATNGECTPPLSVLLCLVPRVLLCLSSGAMPPASRHAFAALSPAERQASLRAADTWPVLSVSGNAASARVYVTARNYDSNVNVNNVPMTPQSSILASLALYWAVGAVFLEQRVNEPFENVSMRTPPSLGALNLKEMPTQSKILLFGYFLSKLTFWPV